MSENYIKKGGQNPPVPTTGRPERPLGSTIQCCPRDTNHDGNCDIHCEVSTMTAPAFGCLNHTIRCNSGTYFDLANPSASKIDIYDIAQALSNLCRFGGQVDRFYSVAEHSVNCADVAINDGQPREVVLAVLLHDAPEAYLGDVVRPLKLMLPEYCKLEFQVAIAIGEAFGIDFGVHASVIREIDDAVLIAERRRLFSSDPETWVGEEAVRSLNIPCRCLRPTSAYDEFMRSFRRFQKS